MEKSLLKSFYPLILKLFTPIIIKGEDYLLPPYYNYSKIIKILSQLKLEHEITRSKIFAKFNIFKFQLKKIRYIKTV